MKELINIQRDLRAPKNRRNSFGGYNYRSCEDILEAVKPLLAANGCTLTITDELMELSLPYAYDSHTNDGKKDVITHYEGPRVYVKATVTLTNEAGETVTTSAYAREELVKAGTDGSQITGAASSYARKYALNGLFCIDDVADADATNTHGKESKESQPKPKQQPQPKPQPQPQSVVPKAAATAMPRAVVRWDKSFIKNASVIATLKNYGHSDLHITERLRGAFPDKEFVGMTYLDAEELEAALKK